MPEDPLCAIDSTVQYRYILAIMMALHDRISNNCRPFSLMLLLLVAIDIDNSEMLCHFFYRNQVMI